MAAIIERARLLAGYFPLNAVLRGRRDRRKRRKHRFWVQAIYQRREQLGLYKTLVQELKHEDVTFDIRRHFENKRGVFWDTFLLHLSYELHAMLAINKMMSYHAHCVLYLPY